MSSLVCLLKLYIYLHTQNSQWSDVGFKAIAAGMDVVVGITTQEPWISTHLLPIGHTTTHMGELDHLIT